MHAESDSLEFWKIYKERGPREIITLILKVREVEKTA